MRLSRPARWFLSAAQETPRLSTATSPAQRFFHASCRCALDNDEPSDGGVSSSRLASTTPSSATSIPAQSSVEALPQAAGLFQRSGAAQSRASSRWTPETGRKQVAERKRQLKELQRRIEERTKEVRRYTPEEMTALRDIYTPQQIEALLAAEEAVDPRDVVTQGEMRTDAAGLAYLDDLASVDPVLDKLAQGPEMRYGTDLDAPPATGEVELAEAAAAAESSASRHAATSGGRARRGDASKAGAALTAAQKRMRDSNEDRYTLRLVQQTGLTAEQIRRLRVKTMVIRRVANQTHMGKVLSFSYLAVAGNAKGLLGIGMGKAIQTEDARAQAMGAAIRNMVPVHRYEGRTIYGEVQAKVGATVVHLMPRAPGFGCRASHLVFEMCRLAGISDIAARTSRSRNPMNVCKATFQALMSQRLPEDVALGRGMKMVDVRKVYYAGNV